MAADITGMFGSLGVSQEDLLRQQGLAQAALPAGRLADVSAPQRAVDFRQSVGGLFGIDTKTTAEKAREALGAIDTTTPEGQQQAIGILASVNPAGALALQDEFNRRKELSAQQDLENQQREEQLAISRARLASDKETTSVADKKAIREASGFARAKAEQANAMYNIGKQYEKYTPPAGLAGKAYDAFNDYMGRQGDISILRTQFNGLKNSIVLNQLPPGAASDKDVQLAMRGWPDATYDAATIASFLKGQAKLAAIAAEKENARSKWLTDKKGDDSGFLDDWRKKVKEEGFEDRIMEMYDFEFVPVTELSQEEFLRKKIEEEKKLAAEPSAIEKARAARGGRR